MNKLSNLPPKGTSDWMPEEFRIRKYIFDTWRKVCLQFGYEEYLTPLVEYAEVYRAKSGDDVGNKELTTFMDRGERELAIRPEMTPSVTRMVSKFYDAAPKPIRLFSIANFMRNEKPQKGRNREFWQLNCDIFGSDSKNADVEVLQLAIEIMKSFGATSKQFIVRLNDRNLIRENILTGLEIEEDKLIPATRVVDNFRKLNKEDFITTLINATGTTKDLAEEFYRSLEEGSAERIDSDSMRSLKELITKMTELGYGEYIVYDPTLVRGFDYYDGMVFEVFDKNPENLRAMFGGGRYNGLASIFGSKSFPAVGFAPGDETTRIFLETWNLIPENLKSETYYLPLLSESLEKKTKLLAQELRSNGKNVIEGLEESRLGKALDYANKSNIDFVVIYGEDESSRGEYSIKDMKSGDQKTIAL